MSGIATVPAAIRPFAGDAAETRALSAIWLEASRRAHGFIGAARLDAQRALVETLYLPRAETWVADHDGAPVGFISLYGAFVGGLFITPSCQSAGVGRSLIAHARARKGPLTLEVYARNTRARRFYAAQGFREVSRRPVDDDGLPFENLLLRQTG